MQGKRFLTKDEFDFYVSNLEKRLTGMGISTVGLTSVGPIDHDTLLNSEGNKHIDWTNASVAFKTTYTMQGGNYIFGAGTVLQLSDDAAMTIYGSNTVNKGASIEIRGASNLSLPGDMYLGYGDYTAAIAATSKCYIRAMDNGSYINAIICDKDGNVGIGVDAVTKFHTDGLSTFENGGVDGTLAIVQYLTAANYASTYRHKIETSHSSNAALNKLVFYLCDGTTTGFTAVFSAIGGYFHIDSIQSGATQGGAGAAAGEVWKTSGHATLPDNVLMIGV